MWKDASNDEYGVLFSPSHASKQRRIAIGGQTQLGQGVVTEAKVLAPHPCPKNG